MAPAKSISGDVFDFFLLDETHLGFMIGDVNGTGVSAALFAAIVRTTAAGAPACGAWRPASACNIWMRPWRINRRRPSL